MGNKCSSKKGYELCRVPIKAVSWDEVSIKKLDNAERIYTINMEFLYWALRYKWYRNLLSKGCTTADGKWVQKLVERKYRINIEQIPGSLLIYKWLEEASSEKLRVAFIGATNKVHEAMRPIISKRFPGIEAFYYDPGIVDLGELLSEEGYKRVEPIVLFIKEKKPDIIFYAFGPPKQELIMDMLSNVMRESGVIAAAGVGGSFAMLAGLEKQASEKIRRLGLEWLWRLVQNPGRIKKVARSVRALACGLWELVSL